MSADDIIVGVAEYLLAKLNPHQFLVASIRLRQWTPGPAVVVTTADGTDYAVWWDDGDLLAGPEDGWPFARVPAADPAALDKVTVALHRFGHPDVLEQVRESH